MSNKRLKLYLLGNPDTVDYDCYFGAVVAAPTEAIARHIHPSRYAKPNWWEEDTLWGWVLPERVIVTHIGSATVGTETGLVLDSFNAG